jgi:aldose 1-epimerase
MNVKILIGMLCTILFLFGCKNNQQPEVVTKTTTTPLIMKTDFGSLADGTKIDLYTMTNKKGMSVSITNYGGIIVALNVPDRTGKIEDVVLGYDSVKYYEANNPYFGAIIGRYGNRIAKGKFNLDGKSYTLATNDVTNHLHGGKKGFDKVVWSAKATDGDNPSLELTYRSKDGEEGYPGNLDTKVTYTLTEDNVLKMEYEATTDATTIVNLCNHSYFNLSAGKSDVTNHVLQINGDKLCAVDATLIPLPTLMDVKNTVFDFTKPTIIAKGLAAVNDVQIKNGLGYDHCWILNKSGADKMQVAAVLRDTISGRVMEVHTTEPGIQFYSGNFLDGTIKGKNGMIYPKRFALCLETQHYPDSPNRPDFPSCVIKPGEVYRSATYHVFKTE